MPRKKRCTLVGLIALAAGLYVVRLRFPHPEQLSDLQQVLIGARAWMAGANPYEAVQTWSKWPYPLRPSDYIRRQIHCTFQDDPMAIAMRGITGVDCLLWGSDYPHHEATWPRSRDALDALFAGVSAEDRAAITGGTLAKLFSF